MIFENSGDARESLKKNLNVLERNITTLNTLALEDGRLCDLPVLMGEAVLGKLSICCEAILYLHYYNKYLDPWGHDLPVSYPTLKELKECIGNDGNNLDFEITENIGKLENPDFKKTIERDNYFDSLSNIEYYLKWFKEYNEDEELNNLIMHLLEINDKYLHFVRTVAIGE